MNNPTKDSITSNIKRLLMFKTLKEIGNIVDSEREQDRKDKRRVVIITIIVSVVLAYIFFALTTFGNPENEYPTQNSSIITKP